MSQTEILIQRWQRGDESAAAALYEQFQARTFRLAYGLLGDHGDAEEVMQDALTYALVNINRFDPERASFSTWLNTITVSRCRDKRKRKRLARFSLTAWLQRGGDIADHRPRPEQAAATEERRNEVWEAVGELKPILREAILLRYWAGHTYREMGEILDCPVRTAQSRVRLAYRQLRLTLTRQALDLREEAPSS
jgi:RNA polymerase sigma-70 factor (ECF subfamily)